MSKAVEYRDTWVRINAGEAGLEDRIPEPVFAIEGKNYDVLTLLFEDGSLIVADRTQGNQVLLGAYEAVAMSEEIKQIAFLGTMFVGGEGHVAN